MYIHININFKHITHTNSIELVLYMYVGRGYNHALQLKP